MLRPYWTKHRICTNKGSQVWTLISWPIFSLCVISHRSTLVHLLVHLPHALPLSLFSFYYVPASYVAYIPHKRSQCPGATQITTNSTDWLSVKISTRSPLYTEYSRWQHHFSSYSQLRHIWAPKNILCRLCGFGIRVREIQDDNYRKKDSSTSENDICRPEYLEIWDQRIDRRRIIWMRFTIPTPAPVTEENV